MAHPSMTMHPTPAGSVAVNPRARRHTQEPNVEYARRPVGTRQIWQVAGLVVLAALAGGVTLVAIDPNTQAQLMQNYATNDTAGRAQDGNFVLSPNDAARIARRTLLRLEDANVTGNYAILHTSAAPSFQANNSPQRLSDIFNWMRTNAITLSNADTLSDADVRFLPAPAPGYVHLTGIVPQNPLDADDNAGRADKPVNFDLLLQQVETQWLMFGVSIYQN